MSLNHPDKTKEAFAIIQEFCIDSIMKSEAGSVLSCYLAAKDGYLDSARIESIKEEAPRKALQTLLNLREGNESNLSMAENRWLRAYIDFAYRTRLHSL